MAMIISKDHAAQLGGAWKLMAGSVDSANKMNRLARGEAGKGSESKLISVLVSDAKLNHFFLISKFSVTHQSRMFITHY